MRCAGKEWSLTMSLMLVPVRRFDPIFDATLGPPRAWSVAHWLNVTPHYWISLLKKMVRRLEATPTPLFHANLRLWKTCQ